jgi:pyruvate/2-oxoglutarate dehydrogenase complex dihydrolipoamide dehydrogenase (E3) component
MERYDLVVIGGGAAGINAAKTAVGLRARVALIDRGPLGGTCINLG